MLPAPKGGVQRAQARDRLPSSSLESRRRFLGSPSSLALTGTSSQGPRFAALAEITGFAELPAQTAGAGGLQRDHLAMGPAERGLQRDFRPVLLRALPANGEELRHLHVPPSPRVLYGCPYNFVDHTHVRR